MSRLWILAALSMFLIGAAIRIHNAYQYPIGMGFDAGGNWDYALTLVESWELPAPDDGWSTAHPPLFYGLAALVGRQAGGDKTSTFIGTRLLMTTAGLISIGLAVALVRRTAPGDLRRQLIAGGLLLFLPVHLYMSAMFSEELLAATFTSVVVTALAWRGAGPARNGSLGFDAGIGVAAGLALLTKLSGLLAIGVAVASVSIEGLRRGALGKAATRAAVIGLIALLVGGWFYTRNLVRYGYLYPHGLEAHAIMGTMPPGERQLADYLRVPLATWTDPTLGSPELLRSVWGSTYVSVWTDGHGHFLPASSPAVDRASRALLVLGLLPTLAWLLGLARGARRVWQGAGGRDLPMLLLVAATLVGYVAFTWRNAQFVVLKGSFLLGLSVPFAFYASELLAEWTDPLRGRRRALLVSAALLALVSVATLTFSFGLVFRKAEYPGIEWRPIEPRLSTLSPGPLAPPG